MTKQYLNGILTDIPEEEEIKRLDDAEKHNNKKAEKKIIEQTIEDNKASGTQKLKDLGLTDDEITAISQHPYPKKEG